MTNGAKQDERYWLTEKGYAALAASSLTTKAAFDRLVQSRKPTPITAPGPQEETAR